MDLSNFGAAQATVKDVRITGRLGTAQAATVAYTDGQFTIDTHVAGGPLGQVRLLDAGEEKSLLQALKATQHQPHPGLDTTALQAFIHLLSGAVHSQPTALFDNVRFGDIARAAGEIVVHAGVGVDVVGTLRDKAGRFTYEQHALPLHGGVPHALSPGDRASLKAALEKFFAANPTHDPLYDELLKDASRR